MTLTFVLNGQEKRVEVAYDDMLVDIVRRLELTGTKVGCGVGVCGACTVIINELPVSSCIYLAKLAEGQEVWTVEGLTTRDPALAEAFVEHEGMQCGICTPGQVVAAYALAEQDPGASEEEIREFMAGNLCRCTGYESILESIGAYLGAR